MGPFDVIRNAGSVAIVRTLDLGDFDEAYRGATFNVWVAPSRAHLQEWASLTAEIQAAQKKAEAGEMNDEEKREALEKWQARHLEWFAETWRNVPLAEAQQIQEALPKMAWEWLTQRTSEMIGEYRREKLGNSRGG
jgi:hypothetical protein